MTGAQRGILVAVVAGSSVVFLDATVVTVALPRIGAALPTPRLGLLEAQAYVYSAYLLSLSSLLVLFGAMGDIHGRRRVYRIGLLAFGATSLACGLAPTMELLLVARVLKGAAGAVLVPASLAIITAAFHGEERGRAFGVWAGASAVATILGPLMGGVLVDTVSWRAVFLLNLPIVGVGLWATSRHVPESRDETTVRRLDWRGSIAIALALAGLTVGAIRGQERAWQDPGAFVALAVGVAAGVAFVLLMARTPDPLVPLDLFRSRNFAVSNLSTVLVYGALYIAMYVVVLYLQGALGYSAAAAGVATVPTVAFLAVASTRMGGLAARHGPRWFMAAGPWLMAAGTLLLTTVTASSAAWTLEIGDPASWAPPGDYLSRLLPGLAVFGLGVMVVVAPLTTALMDSVPEERAGVASAINNALSRVGPQLAAAVLFVAISASFHQALSERVADLDTGDPAPRVRYAPLNPPVGDPTPDEVRAAREASTEAFHLAMVVAAALAASGGVVNAIGIRNPHRPLAPRRPAECLPGAVPPTTRPSG